MSKITHRIENIEKKLNVGRRVRPLEIRVVLTKRTLTDEERQELGPNETWITYQEQLQAGEKANAELLKANPDAFPERITIELDADKEYAARAVRDKNIE